MSKWKTRDIHQRRMQQMHDNIETALGYMQEFCDLYKTLHPKLAEAGEQIAEVMVFIQQNIKALQAAF